MLQTGKRAATIISEQGLVQISDQDQIQDLVEKILDANPDQVKAYLNGKESLENWFFGQAMRLTGGKANPEMLQAILKKALQQRI